MTPIRPIVILGPTSGGKSDLAVAIAQHVRGEVIGADSMQVYRHMNAGTAKPPPQVRRRVPHHLIDVVEPTERFTVADWLASADALIDRIQRQSVTPIVVGGTNLYIRALLEGMFDGPGIDRSFREQTADVSAADLHQRLQTVDPEAAERIHPNDRKRIVRALEVEHVTGKPISQWQDQWESNVGASDGARNDSGKRGNEQSDAATRRRSDGRGKGDRREEGSGGGGERASSGRPQPMVRRGPPGDYLHDPLLIGLQWPVEAINHRINQRVRVMFYPDRADPHLVEALNITESLPEEVRRLHEAGLLGAQARQAIGYKQLIDHIEGRCDLDEAFEQTKVVTRRFARQQRTWMRRFAGIRWIAAAAVSEGQVIDEAISYVN